MFLLAVALTPFSTSFLAEFIAFRVALILYWFNILFLGIMLFISIAYASKAGLKKAEMTPDIYNAHWHRIVIAQLLYAIAVLFCLINTYVSIILIVLIQLNYAIAPRLKLLYRN